MTTQETITIFDKKISVTHEKKDIHELKYFEENPRVFSCIFGEDKPKEDDKLQTLIEAKMLEQPSVKNLIPQIKTHGGLLEPILVRYDTKQVIEGNSRLAAFRSLYKDTKDEKWATIPCNCVSGLTEEEQDAYLSQIHIKGKTSWSAYEKANFAYIRKEKGVPSEEISRRSSVTDNEIEKQIKVVESMKQNNDKDASHFSYYDVIVRTQKINQADNDVKDFILSKIKTMKEEYEEGNGFTALDLRTKLPIVLGKKKALKKFMEGKTTLDAAYQNSRLSNPLKKVKAATDKIEDIKKIEICSLEKSEINALLANIKRLSKEVIRIKGMIEKVKDEKNLNA